MTYSFPLMIFTTRCFSFFDSFFVVGRVLFLIFLDPQQLIVKVFGLQILPLHIQCTLFLVIVFLFSLLYYRAMKRIFLSYMFLISGQPLPSCQYIFFHFYPSYSPSANYFLMSPIAHESTVHTPNITLVFSSIAKTNRKTDADYIR